MRSSPGLSLKHVVRELGRRSPSFHYQSPEKKHTPKVFSFRITPVGGSSHLSRKPTMSGDSNYPQSHRITTAKPSCSRLPTSDVRQACPQTHTIATLLDGMVSVLSSHSGSVSPHLSPAYRKIQRAFHTPRIAKRCSTIGMRKCLPEPSAREAFESIYEAMQAGQKVTGARMELFLRQLGYEMDGSLLTAVLQTHLKRKMNEVVSCEEWLALMSGDIIRAKKGDTELACLWRVDNKAAMLLGIQYQVSKANSAFLCSCSAWQRLAKEMGEVAKCTSVAHSIAHVYESSEKEVLDIIKQHYGRVYTINEEQYLALLLPCVLQDTLYAIACLLHRYWQSTASQSFPLFVAATAHAISDKRAQQS